MYLYNSFYRKFGLRTTGQLMSPALPMLDKLELPQNSIYHYVGNGLLDDGPKHDEFLFRNITRPILLANITAIGDNKGLPRRLAVPVAPLIQTYHAKNRRYRKLIDINNTGRDVLTPVVFSYAFIPRLYKYMRSLYSQYNSWYNVQAAVWKNIAQLSTTNDRHQFIEVKLPQVLPSIPQLRNAVRRFDQRSIKIFNSVESLVLLELWKWLGEERSQSLLNAIPKEGLNKVNLIFIESGRWTVVNLGVLNSWRIASKEELDADPNANTKGFAPEQIQKRFLRMMVSIFECRTSSPAENLGEDVEEDKAAQTPAVQAPSIDTKVTVVDTKVVGNNTPAVTTSEVLTPTEAMAADNARDAGIQPATQIEEDFEVDMRIDEELAELEKLAKVSRHDFEAAAPETEDDEEDTSVQTAEDEDESESVIDDSSGASLDGGGTLDQAFSRIIDRLGSVGMMSVAEYKRYKDLSQSYKSIISPDGTTTLDKFIKINPEDTKIKKSQAIPDIKTVFDKTMLKSSLLTFDDHYIKNILQKDVAGMVMNIQRAGIAVTDYEVERVDDILGSYDSYTVRVTPVEGASSTLKFKLPVIEEDGTFMANGTKYRDRKQRGD